MNQTDTSTGALDRVMEAASEALARMDYLGCEALCLEALGLARGQGDWAYYARILLPLQEARRQRRMIAAEGVVRLGTSDLAGEPASWLDKLDAGCIALTQPHTAEHALKLAQAARQQRRCIEVLLADNPADAPRWTLRSFAGPAVACQVAAPPSDWLNKWLWPGDQATVAATAAAAGAGGSTVKAAVQPADWFLDACEALGDAALAQTDTIGDGAARLQAIEQCLAVVTDHEIIHQRLGAAARALRGT